MKKIFLVAIAVLCGLSLSAQGSTIFNFARLDYNPTTAGMAGAGAAQSQLAFGAYANPSLMTLAEKKCEIALGYQNFAPKLDATHNASLGAGFRFGKFAVALAGTYLIEKPYSVVTSPSGSSNTKYTPKDLQFGAAFGYQILDCLSAGVNARLYHTALAEDAKYTGFGMDIFAAYHYGMFTATAGVSNVGAKVKKQYMVPASATVAGSVNAANLGICGLLADVDFDYFFNGGISCNVGGQFSILDIFAIRAGYHFATAMAPVPSYASAGISLGYKLFHVNASYTFASKALANTFSVGLSFAF